MYKHQKVLQCFHFDQLLCSALHGLLFNKSTFKRVFTQTELDGFMKHLVKECGIEKSFVWVVGTKCSAENNLCTLICLLLGSLCVSRSHLTCKPFASKQSCVLADARLPSFPGEYKTVVILLSWNAAVVGLHADCLGITKDFMRVMGCWPNKCLSFCVMLQVV